jgi:alpha-methylacyl-CoA racemase
MTSLLPALAGVRVIEIESLGPAPFAAMILADLGAEVIRIRRPGGGAPRFMPAGEANAVDRGRCGTIELDLKKADHRDALLELLGESDVLLEGFRPGVMERLDLGPEVCFGVRPALVYGRMTGWGQAGPWADRAGHDINYIAATGALHAIGRAGQGPVPPLSLVGDYGGGAMFLLVGVLSALNSARNTGRGRVVDAAIVDGVSLMMSTVWGRFSAGQWKDERGSNLLDGGAPFYDVYCTADGGYLAVGALEPQFFDNLCRVLGLLSRWHRGNQMREEGWGRMRAEFTSAFASRTRNEWALAFEGVDACVSPVLSLTEASSNEHIQSRHCLQEVEGVVMPGPAPRMGNAPAHCPPLIDLLRSARMSAASCELLLKHARTL